MHENIVSEYRRIREPSVYGARLYQTTARDAIRIARINYVFQQAVESEIARLRIVPDEELYDDSYLETWGLTDRQLEHHRTSLWNKIDSEGVWGIVCETKCQCCGSWGHSASCWGFVGQDFDLEVKYEVLCSLKSQGADLDPEWEKIKPTA